MPNIFITCWIVAIFIWRSTFPFLRKLTRGGAVVARQAHNLKVEGSSPSPATSYAEREDAGSSPARNDHLVYGARSDGFKVP